MQMKYFFLLVLTVYLISLPLTAENGVIEEGPFDRLMKAKTLKCFLGKGCQANWNKGEPELEIGEFSSKKEDCVLIFDSIDLEKGTARFIGNQGSIDVVAFTTLAGITFIEEAGSGSVSITTVFATYKKGSEDLIFVHSRHIAPMIIAPIPSQYHGVCKILE